MYFNVVANFQIYEVIQQRLLLCSAYCYLVSGEGDRYIWNYRVTCYIEEYWEMIMFPGEGVFRLIMSINLQLLYHVAKLRLHPFNPFLLPHRDESTFLELCFCWFLNFHLFPHHSVGILRKAQFLNHPSLWASTLSALA